MADSKLTALTEDTAPASTDYAYTVKDPTGSPLSRRATWLNIFKGQGLGILTSNGDLLTRAAGAVTNVTRAALAADSAFTAAFANKTLDAVLASGTAALTDTTPNSLTLVQWGTEEAVVAQADCPTAAVVMAWLSGSMRAGPGTISANDRGGCEVQVSFDGGSNFSTIGLGINATLPVTATTRDYTVARNVRTTGTVTGDIQVRARVQDISAANDTTWVNGVLTVLVHPQ